MRYTADLPLKSERRSAYPMPEEVCEFLISHREGRRIHRSITVLMISPWRIPLWKVDSDMGIKFHVNVIKNQPARSWQNWRGKGGGVSAMCRNYVHTGINSLFHASESYWDDGREGTKLLWLPHSNADMFYLFCDSINLWKVKVPYS